jgi:hypothetical protein
MLSHGWGFHSTSNMEYRRLHCQLPTGPVVRGFHRLSAHLRMRWPRRALPPLKRLGDTSGSPLDTSSGLPWPTPPSSPVGLATPPERCTAHMSRGALAAASKALPRLGITCRQWQDMHNLLRVIAALAHASLPCGLSMKAYDSVSLLPTQCGGSQVVCVAAARSSACTSPHHVAHHNAFRFPSESSMQQRAPSSNALPRLTCSMVGLAGRLGVLLASMARSTAGSTWPPVPPPSPPSRCSSLGCMPGLVAAAGQEAAAGAMQTRKVCLRSARCSATPYTHTYVSSTDVDALADKRATSTTTALLARSEELLVSKAAVQLTLDSPAHQAMSRRRGIWKPHMPCSTAYLHRQCLASCARQCRQHRQCLPCAQQQLRCPCPPVLQEEGHVP